MSAPRIAFPAACALLALAWSLVCSGCGDGRGVMAQTGPAPDGFTRRYHDGRGWVPVSVLPNRLRLTLSGGAALPPLPEGCHASAVHDGFEVAFAPRVDLQALDDLATGLAARPGVAGVQAELRGGDDAALQVLTRRLLVQVAPGTDIRSLAEAHHAVALEPAGFAADTWVVEARSAGLLAALATANSLRDRPGVVSSQPLIRRVLRAPEGALGADERKAPTGDVRP